MTMQATRARKMLALVLTYAISVLPSLSCATSSTQQFAWSLHPMLPVKPYTHGNLGIVLPTFARSYLVIAYRYFSGKDLSAREADQANQMIEKRLAATDISCDVDESSWLNARKSAFSGSANTTVDTSASISADSPSNICNIQTNAFVTAAKTLQTRITKYGAANPAIKDWIAAQDMVFSNGTGLTPTIPKTLQTADKLLQEDRAYQIAAANFYAMQFDAALELFSKIAQDTDSPWAHISRYLAIRSLIRKATTSKDPFDTDLMTEAKKQIDTLLLDRSMSDLHDDLVDLADFVVDKLAPSDTALAKQREHQLATAMMSNITQRGLMEYTNVLDRMLGDSDDDDSNSKKKPAPLLTGVEEITDWIDTFKSPKAVSRAHALARWQSTKSLPWLIAVLSVTEAKDSDIPQLLAAAAKVPPSNHAFATVSYEVARLLMSTKQFDLARTHIDQVLAIHDLDRSSHNLLLDLRLQLARNVNEFVRDSIAKDLGTWGGDQDEVPDPDPTDKFSQPSPKQAVLPLACQLYDDSIPLVIFKTASQSKLYSAENSTLLAKRAWVKAILLGNETIAKALANTLKTTDKEYAKYYNSYLKAGTPAERKFAAAVLMLHDDNASPTLANGIGWWWGVLIIRDPHLFASETVPIDYQRVIKYPVFLTAADRQACATEVAILKKTPAAPAYLAGIAVEWAKSHPSDPRVPETLHLAVRCTKLGERDSASTKLSKEAFLILHHKYANNHWTQATPYYY